MSNSVYYGEGIVSIWTSDGVEDRVNGDGVVATVGADAQKTGTYTFDMLPTVCVVQNGVSDEFYLAAYRIELPKTNTTPGLNGDDILATADDEWLLSRYRAVDTADKQNVVFDSDVKDTKKTGVAGGFIVAGQNNDGSADKHFLTRQLDGQVILAEQADEDSNQNTTETVNGSENMSDDKQDYDWMKEPAVGEDGDETIPAKKGGDVGEVLPPYQTISGIIWTDRSNDGIQNDYDELNDDGTTAKKPEEGRDGVKVSLERYWQLPGETEWHWDTEWADPYPTDYDDYYSNSDNRSDNTTVAGVGRNWTRQTETATEITGAEYERATYTFNEVEQANTYTHAEDASGNEVASDDVSAVAHGVYRFANLKSSDVRVVGEGENAKPQRIVYGYKVRVTDEDFRSRRLATAWHHKTDDYTLDSDLIHQSGYLMDAGEYAVLLNAADDENYVKNSSLNPAGDTHLLVPSQPSNVVANANSYNADQNALDRYGRVPASSVVKDVPAQGETAAVTAPATLSYDLAKGADRAHNDGGVMDIVLQSISGYVWTDVKYDGLLKDDDANVSVGGLDEMMVEKGIEGKRVILKQWYFDPEVDKDGNVTGEGGEWIRVMDFGDEVPATPAQDAGDDQTPSLSDETGTLAAALFAVLNSAASAALSKAALTGTRTTLTQGELKDDSNKVIRDAGYYIFENLPVYVNVKGKEYLAGYTVEVKAGSDADAINGRPVTKIEVPLDGEDDETLNSEVHKIGSTVIGSDKVTYSETVHTSTNYPVYWNQLTKQVDPADVKKLGVTTAWWSWLASEPPTLSPITR